MNTKTNNTAVADTKASQDALNLKAQQVITGVSHEVQNFLADIEDLIQEASTLTGVDLAKAKEKLSKRVMAAKNSVQGMGSEVKQRARQGATMTNDYVHEQPWAAIGVAAIAGLALGFIISRR